MTGPMEWVPTQVGGLNPLGNAYRGVDLWTLGMDAIWLF